MILQQGNEPFDLTTRRGTMRIGKVVRIVGLLAVISVGAAACSSGPSTTAGTLRPGKNGLTLFAWKTAQGTGVGSIAGIVAYADKNETSSKIECKSTSCTKTWHPWLTYGVAVHTEQGSGVQSSLIGTIKRPDGTEQMTYGGHPLYLYAHPTKALVANAQGAGGVWYIVGLNGQQITS
jgi:predicted lipoprotein with Yx(FWY)xxD motif